MGKLFILILMAFTMFSLNAIENELKVRRVWCDQEWSTNEDFYRATPIIELKDGSSWGILNFYRDFFSIEELQNGYVVISKMFNQENKTFSHGYCFWLELYDPSGEKIGCVPVRKQVAN